MSFLTQPGAPLYRAQLQAQALHAWREAEQLVCERWSSYRAAGRDTRTGAFAAYLAALDAEALAAHELAIHFTDLQAVA